MGTILVVTGVEVCSGLMGVYRFLAPKTGEVLPEGFRDLDVFKASTRSLRSLTGEDLPPGAYWNVGWRTGDNLSGCSGEVSGEELTTGLYLKQKFLLLNTI